MMNKFNLNKYFKLPNVLIFLILLLASSMRFYRIREYILFLGDEGRDVLIVKRMIVDHVFTLLGPITSVGSMYMGPVYYYFMAPFLWAWRLDPVGPSIMVALFSLATIYLIYRLCCEFFSPYVGIIASFFYAVSPLTVIYGRSSWNPNIVPFFSLLIIYCLMKVVIQNRHRWLIVAGFTLGILIQLHYVTLLMIPVIIFCLALLKFKLKLKYYIFSFLAFITAYSPFLLFEIRHRLVNTMAVLRFIRQQNHEAGFSLDKIIYSIQDILIRVFWRLIVIESAELAKIITLGIIIGVCIYWIKSHRDKPGPQPIDLLLIWFITAVSFIGLYQGVVYDYYLGSIFPVPFLFLGIAVFSYWSDKNLYNISLLLTLAIIFSYNIKHSPLAIEPNNLIRNTQEISRSVFDLAENKPYNFALIAGRNSDHAYRYFLEIWGEPPVEIANPVVDPMRKTVTSQLLVVCEEKICQPLGHPLWQIAGFGRAEIVGEWQVSTAKVFKLIPYNPSRSNKL